MTDVFNFSNPVLAFLNAAIIITFLAILFVGYRLSALFEFYKQCQEYNEENDKYVRDDFEPFFNGYEGYTKESFMGDIFNEYSKYYKKSQNTEQNKADKIIKTRSESFPKCYKTLGFTEKPKDISEIKSKYRDMAKRLHPDLGGSEEFFVELTKAYKESLAFWEKEHKK